MQGPHKLLLVMALVAYKKIGTKKWESFLKRDFFGAMNLLQLMMVMHVKNHGDDGDVVSDVSDVSDVCDVSDVREAIIRKKFYFTKKFRKREGGVISFSYLYFFQRLCGISALRRSQVG